MTLDLFQQLSHEVQLYFVLTRSTFLAWRWQGQSPVLLYHLPTAGRDFFVELTVDAEQTYFMVLRSFSDSEPLEEYAQGVRLPGLKKPALEVLAFLLLSIWLAVGNPTTSKIHPDLAGRGSLCVAVLALLKYS